MTLYRHMEHEVGRLGCATGWHCHSHNVDEWEAHPYQECAECGHVFRTRRALKREHLALVRRLVRRNDYAWVPAWARWLSAAGMVTRALLVRPSRIWSCPFCAHDF